MNIKKGTIIKIYKYDVNNRKKDKMSENFNYKKCESYY